MKESIEFTPREKMLINYYRDRQLSGGSRTKAYHLAFIIAPLLCAGLFFWSNEGAWLFIGFALFLYHACQGLWSDITYSASFSGIFEKYEARLKELDPTQKGSG
jgi:hypothetical protein